MGRSSNQLTIILLFACLGVVAITALKIDGKRMHLGAAPAALSTHQLPSFTPNFTAGTTEVIISEGVSVDCLAQTAGPLGRGRKNCSSAHGWYSMLERLDLGQLVYLWPVSHANETSSPSLACKVYDLGHTTPPIPTPSFEAFEFIADTVWMGAAAQNYRIFNGRYMTSLVTTAEKPLAVLDPLFGNVKSLFYRFEPTNFTDLSIFDVPSVCTSSNSRRKMMTAEEVLSLPVHMLPSAAAMERVRADYARDQQKKTASIHKEDVVDTTTTPAPSSTGKPKLPTTVDHRRFCTPVRDQGACGCCWSFSSAALAELLFYKARNVSAPSNTSGWLSMQSLIDCVHGDDDGKALIESKGCFGGDPHTALKFIAETGIATEATYRFEAANGRRCKLFDSSSTKVEIVRPIKTSYNLKPYDLYEFEHAVAVNGGFVVAMNSQLNSWLTWDGKGVYNDPDCGPGLGHAVLVVGYGTTAEGLDYWLVKNSFGAQWGDAGYFRIAKGVNMCGIEGYAITAEAARAV